MGPLRAPDRSEEPRGGRAGPQERASLGPRLAEHGVGAALAAGLFVLHLRLALELDRLAAFERFNTLFGADPNLRLEALRHGDTLFRLPHPGLAYLLGVPVRSAARMASALAPGGLAAAEAGRAVALGVAPLAAALQCLILLRLLRRVGFGLGTAILLTLLSAVSFSAIVFGSMPETYAVSGLAIAAACALLPWSAHKEGAAVELAWLGTAIFASGITITNIVPVAALYSVRTAGRSGRTGTAVARTIGIAVLALLIATAGGLAADRFLRVRRTSAPSEKEWIARYFVEDPAVHLATFPTAIANGIVPPPPTRVPGFGPGKGPVPAAAPERRDAGADRTTPEEAHGDGVKPKAEHEFRTGLFRLTFEPSHRVFSLRNLCGVALLAALAWGALRRGEGNAYLRSLARASLVIVGFNWVFHGFWGSETFLYSQHWHVPLVLLVAALVAAPLGRRRPAIPLLALSVVAIAVSNLFTLAATLRLSGSG